MNNFFEGFGKWLSKLGVDAKYTAEQDLVLFNVTLLDNQGKPIQFPGASHWKVVKSSPDQKWAKIRNQNFSDPSNRRLTDFPQGFSPSYHAGQEFLITGKEYDKLMTPMGSPGGPPAGSMGGALGGLGG